MIWRNFKWIYTKNYSVCAFLDPFDTLCQFISESSVPNSCCTFHNWTYNCNIQEAPLTQRAQRIHRASLVYFMTICWWLINHFLAKRTWTCVHVRRSICRRPSVCPLSVVWNVRAPNWGDWNFPQCFYAIWYLGHLLMSILRGS